MIERGGGRGELITQSLNVLFDPYCNLCLLIPLFVCTFVVTFCNKSMLKRKEGREARKRERKREGRER